MEYCDHALITNHQHPLAPHTPRCLTSCKEDLRDSDTFMGFDLFERILYPIFLSGSREIGVCRRVRVITAGMDATRCCRRNTRLSLHTGWSPAILLGWDSKGNVILLGPRLEAEKVPKKDLALCVADGKNGRFERLREQAESHIERSCIYGLELDQTLVSSAECGASLAELVGRWCCVCCWDRVRRIEPFNSPQYYLTFHSTLGEDQIIVKCNTEDVSQSCKYTLNWERPQTSLQNSNEPQMLKNADNVKL